MTDSAARSLESGLREWLDEETKQEADAMAAAESFRGVDTEARIDLSRSAARHRDIANRIRRVLYEAGIQ